MPSEGLVQADRPFLLLDRTLQISHVDLELADARPATGDEATTRRRTHDFDTDHSREGMVDRANRMAVKSDWITEKQV